MKSSQYLNLVVKPKGIDVNLRLFGPDSKQLTEIDTPNGPQGSKVLAGILPGAGTYHVEVVSTDTTAPAGRYEVRVSELQTPTKIEQTEQELTDLLQNADAVKWACFYRILCWRQIRRTNQSVPPASMGGLACFFLTPPAHAGGTDKFFTSNVDLA
ncbi:MAG: hypothetical protein HY774_22610 [Acidobacteria bacterium]|nr:hypothetical protein [Acidobacteriota bacterium]